MKKIKGGEKRLRSAMITKLAFAHNTYKIRHLIAATILEVWNILACTVHVVRIYTHPYFKQLKDSKKTSWHMEERKQEEDIMEERRRGRYAFIHLSKP